MPETQKRGLLAVLFGLGEDDLNKLFGGGKPVAAPKQNSLKRILTRFHKYIRREAKPGGGYNYIYEEPKEGSKKKAPVKP